VYALERPVSFALSSKTFRGDLGDPGNGHSFGWSVRPQSGSDNSAVPGDLYRRPIDTVSGRFGFVEKSREFILVHGVPYPPGISTE